MKRLILCVLVLITTTLWGADQVNPKEGLGDTGSVKNFDNRSEKAVKDMTGKQKSVDVNDPRNLNDGVMPVGLGDQGGASGSTHITAIAMPGGLGDKDGGKDANIINPVHQGTDIVGVVPDKVITPNKTGTDIDNDHKHVHNIAAAIGDLFSGELRVGAIHLRQDGGIVNDFVGSFNLNIEDHFGATGYQIRVGTLQSDAPGYRWHSFSDLSELGVISAHLTYDSKNIHFKAGRMVNPIDTNGYFIASNVPLDGIYLSHGKRIKEEAMFVVFTGQNDWEEGGIVDNNFMGAFKVTAAVERAKIALGYYWLHGDSFINYFGTSSFRGRFLQEEMSVANSTFKVDNHYITMMMGYDYHISATQKLAVTFEGGLNLSMDDENWGLQVAANYSYKKLSVESGFHYRRQNSVPTPFTDQYLTTDTLGAIVRGGYALNDRSDVILEGIFTDSISGLLEPKTVITVSYQITF